MAKDNTKSIVESVCNYKREAEQAKQTRMEQNRKNIDFYHMKQDFTHKIKGQSREFLPRQAMAAEQISQFLHQGLVDLSEFYSVEKLPGVREPLFSQSEARSLLSAHLMHADAYSYFHDAIKSGLVGSLLIGKVGGALVPKPRYWTRELKDQNKLMKSKDKAWQLKLDLVRQKNFYPDPTGEGLYIVEELEMDFWRLEQLSKEFPEDFDAEAMSQLKQSLKSSAMSQDTTDLARETNQNASPAGYRNRVKLLECWGNLLDPATGELLHEKKVCLIANERYLIQPPRPYPSWLGTHPYVFAPLLRTPHSVWHKALMDGPTWLNQAMNEIFNLIIDSGLQSVFGIKQIRAHWLENPAEIAEGIVPGQTLSLNQAAPPQAKVLERIDTGSMSSEAISAFNLASGEFNQSALQNDLRVGTLPPRAVKATEVVEASQSITSVFTGIGKCLESQFVEPLLAKAWVECVQNLKAMDKSELKAILGEERAKMVLKLSQEEIFARAVSGYRFRVFGITQTMNKIKDFRKLTAVLQTIATHQALGEAFVKDFDFTKLLREIMESLDVNIDRIKHDAVMQSMNDRAMGGMQAQAPGPQGPDMQSQIPQMASDNNMSEADNIEMQQVFGGA